MTDSFHSLTERLHHPDSNLRSRAALELGQLGDARGLDALLAALTSEPELLVREDITWAVARFGAAAVPALLALLADKDPAARHHAAHTLGKLGDALGVDALIGVLDDADPNVVQKAAVALGQIGDVQALAALVELLGSDDRQIQATVHGVLESFGAAALAPLADALGSPRWQVREQAADILGQIADGGAVPALSGALADADWQVRFAAANALGAIDTAAARRALQAALQDDDARVRGLASRMLGGA